MTIYYRILSVDENEFSFVVRYYTDALSERELSIDPNEQSDTPERCRTDYNLNLWRDMTEENLHQHIMQSAPVQWLMRKERVKARSPDYTLSIATVKAAVGSTFARPVLPSGAIDASVRPTLVSLRVSTP